MVFLAKTLLKEKRPFLYPFKIYTKDYTLPSFTLWNLASAVLGKDVFEPVKTNTDQV